MLEIKQNFIHDENLSLGAKGLFLEILVLKNKNDLFLFNLEKMSMDKKEEILFFLKELVDNGYLEKNESRKIRDFLINENPKNEKTAHFLGIKRFKIPKNGLKPRNRLISLKKKNSSRLAWFMQFSIYIYTSMLNANKYIYLYAHARGFANFDDFEKNLKKIIENYELQAKQGICRNENKKRNKGKSTTTLENKNLFEIETQIPSAEKKTTKLQLINEEIKKFGEKYNALEAIETFFNMRNKKNLKLESIRVMLQEVIDFTDGDTSKINDVIKNAISYNRKIIIAQWMKEEKRKEKKCAGNLQKKESSTKREIYNKNSGVEF